MDNVTAQLMSSLTSDFYRRVGESFSATRGSSWPGWERVLAAMEPREQDVLRVLDLACGNLRFERALFERFPRARAHAVDSCDGMAHIQDARVTFQHLDIAQALFKGELFTRLDASRLDAAVSLAFMHHLPLYEQRVGLMDALAESVRPGGIAAVSFWQFADDARLLAKAQAATAIAAERYDLSSFGKDDYLMGWQDERDAFRFCHHCSDDEIDALIESVAGKARVLERFSADGASGALNQYVILECKGAVS